MKKLKILLFCSILLLFYACSSSRQNGNYGNAGTESEKPPMGKKEPLMSYHYIGSKKFNPNIAEPQLNLQQALAVQYFLHGNISIDGTIITNSQYVETGVVNITNDKKHLTTVAANGTKLVLVNIEGNTFILQGNIQGQSVLLRFAPGKGNKYYFYPVNGTIVVMGENFRVSGDSYESYLEIVVNRGKTQESIVTKIEGISIEQGSPDNGDGNNGGNYEQNYSNPQYQQNNNPSNQPQQQNQPSRNQGGLKPLPGTPK